MYKQKLYNSPCLVFCHRLEKKRQGRQLPVGCDRILFPREYRLKNYFIVFLIQDNRCCCFTPIFIIKRNWKLK